MINEAKKFLIEWVISFINNRNIALKNLEKIEKNKEGFELKALYDDKEEYIIVEPFIENFDVFFDKIDNEKNISVFLFNTTDNFGVILENWKRFIDLEKITIYFINMFSNTDKKWVVKPYLHNKITDEKSLGKGLKSMFNMVEPITQKEVEKFINKK